MSSNSACYFAAFGATAELECALQGLGIPGLGFLAWRFEAFRSPLRVPLRAFLSDSQMHYLFSDKLSRSFRKLGVPYVGVLIILGSPIFGNSHLS